MMKIGWSALPRKIKIVRIANIVGLIVIVVLLAVNKERFRAMLDPAADDIIGAQAPEFAAGEWLNSSPLTLRELRGRIVIVDFWTFGCQNCINVLPDVKRWHEKYNNRGVTLVAVHSPETEAEANLNALKEFIEANDITYPVLTDNDFAMWNRYRVQFWPSTFVIDREGYIRTFHYGELGISSVEHDVENLLASN